MGSKRLHKMRRRNTTTIDQKKRWPDLSLLFDIQFPTTKNSSQFHLISNFWSRHYNKIVVLFWSGCIILIENENKHGAIYLFGYSSIGIGKRMHTAWYTPPTCFVFIRVKREIEVSCLFYIYMQYYTQYRRYNNKTTTSTTSSSKQHHMHYCATLYYSHIYKNIFFTYFTWFGINQNYMNSSNIFENRNKTYFCDLTSTQ